MTNVIQFPLSIEFDDEALSDLYKVQVFLRQVVIEKTSHWNTYIIQSVDTAINLLTEEVSAYMVMVGGH